MSIDWSKRGSELKSTPAGVPCDVQMLPDDYVYRSAGLMATSYKGEEAHFITVTYKGYRSFDLGVQYEYKTHLYVVTEQKHTLTMGEAHTEVTLQRITE